MQLNPLIALIPSLALTASLEVGLAVAQEVPFDGVVAEDHVEVRAGAGRAYYVVGQLDAGVGVRVDEMIYGWYKVEPPKGVFSYVSKANVDVKGDGKKGVVNENRTDVKAASVDGPGKSYRAQVVLNRGDAVEVIGEDGDFYRVVPPGDAYVFLPPGSVTRGRPAPPSPERVEQTDVQPVEAVRVESDRPAPDIKIDTGVRPTPTRVVEVTPDPRRDELEVIDLAQPGAGSGGEVRVERVEPIRVEPERVEVVAVEPERVVGEPRVLVPIEPVRVVEPRRVEVRVESTRPVESERPVDVRIPEADVVAMPERALPERVEVSRPEVQITSPARSERAKAVEDEMLPLLQRPLGSQPLDRIESVYRELALDDSLPEADKKLVELRLEQVQRNRTLASSLSDVAEARRDLDRSHGEAQEAADEVRSRTPMRYDAVGRLMASSVYDGTTRPRMYRLIDPGSGRTIAYVDPAEDRSGVDAMLGQLIGVTGSTAYDPATKLRVIQVDQAVALEGAVMP